MGSFLLNCGVSNSVLGENTPITLVFLSRPMMSNGKPVNAEFFNDWNAEKLLIQAVQHDYGGVEVDKAQRSRVELIMALLYENSVEGSSWKGQFEDSVGTVSKMKKMSVNNLMCAFNEMITLLHSEGILYYNDIMNMTCQMKVAHVDALVMEGIENSPIYFDGMGFDYNGKSDYSRDVISNFENFIDYLVLKNKAKFEKYVKSEFSSGLDNFGSFDVEGDMLLLVRDDVYIPMEERNIQSVIETFVTKKRDGLFITYARNMGVRFSPSLYASQDYSDDKGRSYRNLMKNVFAKQKERNFEQAIERSFDRKIGLDGIEIGEKVSFKSYTKDKEALMSQYMGLPDVVVTEDNKILTPQADGYVFLNKQVKE